MTTVLGGFHTKNQNVRANLYRVRVNAATTMAVVILFPLQRLEVLKNVLKPHSEVITTLLWVHSCYCGFERLQGCYQHGAYFDPVISERVKHICFTNESGYIWCIFIAETMYNLSSTKLLLLQSTDWWEWCTVLYMTLSMCLVNRWDKCHWLSITGCLLAGVLELCGALYSDVDNIMDSA